MSGLETRIFESESLCGKQLDPLPPLPPRERQEVYSLERTWRGFELKDPKSKQERGEALKIETE